MVQNVRPIDLTMGWSHDIRTHLYIIKGAVDMMQSGRLTQEQSREYTEMIRQNVSAMEKLMNHLLNGIGKEPMGAQANEWADANGLLRRVLENVTPFAADRRVELIHDIEDDLRLLCNPEMLERVLYNMITNALKCTEAGGVVYLHAKKSDAHVRITISDTGCGMPDELLAQLHGGSDHAVGEGYGLKLVKSMVEEMNGQMECASQVNVGTTFYLYLPERYQLPNAFPAKEAGD